MGSSVCEPGWSACGIICLNNLNGVAVQSFGVINGVVCEVVWFS